MNQPKTYTAASNQRYILRELWHYDRSTIFYALAEIITQIGKGFGTILIPSMIVAFLEQYQKGMITQETLPGAVPGIFCLQHGNVRLTILSSGKALYLFRFPLHMPDGPDSPVSL